ncbi:MAG: class I SAM-dependent methyltransferase family protein [Desulfobulbus sp.]
MQLRPLLAQHFPDIDPIRLPGGFDRVGDIAVIGITPELMPHAQAIGKLLLAHNSSLKVVARRAGEYEGEYRTRTLELVAGEGRLTTVHRENGVVLHLDLARVYYSVRSAHERARIAALVRPGERVCVLCSGVGPFPLIIARHSQAREVIGIEKNPVAHNYALKNLRANRKLRRVRFLEGDASEVLSGLEPGFDHILIVLPYGGEPLLPAALLALRPGGMLHFYDMQIKGCHSATLAKAEAAAQALGLHVQPLQVVTCGNCGSSVQRVCLDAVITATM